MGAMIEIAPRTSLMSYVWTIRANQSCSFQSTVLSCWQPKGQQNESNDVAKGRHIASHRHEKSFVNHRFGPGIFIA